VPDLLDSLREALADRYAVERELGRGGMATVFLAEDLKHHRSVAIKVLHAELAAALGAERSCMKSRSPLACSIPIFCPCTIPARRPASSITSCRTSKGSPCGTV